MKPAFVITSAINSRFGVYNPVERLEQTLQTIKSVRERCPDAKIVIMECTGVPLTTTQTATLTDNCDYLIDFTQDPDVQDIYRSTDNWDVVKNSTEIMCFARALHDCTVNHIFDDVDRVFKLSGRYILTDDFKPELYDRPDVQDRIVIGRKHQSQFPIAVTQTPLQYMARLWSWPVSDTAEVIGVYNQSLAFFAERVSQGGYVDIEHVLWKFLPASKVLELERTGVTGNIAPTGSAISD